MNYIQRPNIPLNLPLQGDSNLNMPNIPLDTILKYLGVNKPASSTYGTQGDSNQNYNKNTKTSGEIFDQLGITSQGLGYHSLPTGEKTVNRGSTQYGYLYGSGLGSDNGNGDLTNYLISQLLGWQLDNNSDRSHEAYQNFLNRLLTLDQRKYDSPAAQVQRLMDAGVSREAALALVNGSAGAGSTQQSVDALAPSESRLNEEQTNQLEQEQVLAPINTAFNGIQSITGLFGAATQGLSIPGIIANNTIAQNNAYASDLIRGAKDGIGVMNGVLSSARSLGQLSDDDVKTPDSIQDWFNRQTPDTNGAAHDFVQSGQLQRLYENPFGRTAIDDNFCTLRNPERVNAEIQNAEAEAEFRRLNNAGKKVENAMLKIRKSFEETQEARSRMEFVDWQKVHDKITDAYMYELEQRLIELSQIRDPKVAELVAQRMFKREEMQAALWEFQAQLYQHALDTEGNYDSDVAAMKYLSDKLGFTDSELGRTFTPIVVSVGTAIKKSADVVKSIYSFGKDFIKRPDFGAFAPPDFANQIYQ